MSRKVRTTSAAAAVLAAVALAVPAASATAVAGAAAAAGLPTATPTGAEAAGVVLPTGDRVVVGTGAHSGLAVEQVPGGSDAFAGLKIGGDQYVIPAEAAPYLGRVLDLSLFDVTKPAAGAGADHRVPVQLRFAAGVTPAAPAGVTLTSVSGQLATGYLTPDSGRAFAQALRDGIKADQAAGHRPGTAPLFGGLVSMTALGASTPVTPNYPLHILQVNALDTTGAPASTGVLLVNVDNAREFTAPVFTYNGVGRVAVPAGDYAALTVDFTFDSTGGAGEAVIVSQDGIVVPATGAVPAVTVDERTATSAVSLTTQKPATHVAGYTQVTRLDANGVGTGVTLFAGTLPVYLTPAPKPAIGSLGLTVNWIGASPASASAPYRYNLVENSDQISADQTYAPADSSLAAIQHSFSTDPAYGPNLPFIGSGYVSDRGWALAAIPSPGRSVTEYLTGGLRWFSEEWLPQVPDSQGFNFGIIDADSATYTAGQTVARSWSHAPSTPNFGRHAAAPNSFGCQACAGAGSLNITPGMLGDSNRDTTGLDFGASGTAQLYWNGQLVSSDVDRFGYLVRNIPAGPATVRGVFDYDLTATGVSQSTKTHTDVTVPYSGVSDPSLTLPAGVDCPEADATPTSCQILPALTLNYQLNALTDRNTSHSPVQNLVLNVGHLSYGGVGSQAPVTCVHVSVSFDDGATWHDVATHGGGETYTAHWSNPAAGSPVELRVTASDALGGSITQTVTNPYTVG